MIVPPHREGGQAQFIAQPVPKNTRDARINGLLEYLQQHMPNRIISTRWRRWWR
jgi:transcriptional regulator GlxA family with amidase domain